MSKVVIVADPATGSVIFPSNNNPEWGYVKLAQTRTMIDENGFLNKRVLRSIIKAPIVILQEMNYKGGQVLEGTLVIKEQLEPFNKKDPERDIKIAGKTGIICRVGDQPIYRKTLYRSNPDQQDILLEHTNKEELRTAYQIAIENSVSTKEFDI